VGAGTSPVTALAPGAANTVVGSNGTSFVSLTGSALGYWSGYHPNGNTWSTTSTSFADPTSSGTTPAITNRANSGITVTQSGTTPSITFTPSSASAVYQIEAKFSIINNSQFGAFAQLTDGTNIIDSSGSAYIGETVSTQVYAVPCTLSGIYSPGTTSPVTVKIQLATSTSSTTFIEASFNGSINTCIEWTVVQIPTNIISSVSSSLIGAMVTYGVFS